MKTVTENPAAQKHKKRGGLCCHRCGGLMVREYVAELNEDCWKCVVCGERVDLLILAHREEKSG